MALTRLFLLYFYYLKIMSNGHCTIDSSSSEVIMNFYVSIWANQTDSYNNPTGGAEVTIWKASGDLNIEVRGELSGTIPNTGVLMLSFYFTSTGQINLGMQCETLSTAIGYIVKPEMLVLNDLILVLII